MKCKDVLSLDTLCSCIEQIGFATGSRVIGGYKPKSDYDYVMTVKQTKDLYEYIGLEFNVKSLEQYACLFSSFKYTDSRGRVINLILVDGEVDYDAWMHATIMTTNDYAVGSGSDIRKKIFGDHLANYYEMSFERLSKDKLAMIKATWRTERTQSAEAYFQYKRSYGA